MAIADLDWKLRLGFLVHDVTRLRRSMIDRVFKPLNITRSQWWVLAFLSRRDGMPQVALAEELDLGKVALGGLLDRLEASGMLERRPDFSDRRVKRVHLTKSGSKLTKQMRLLSAQTEHQILNGISDDDLQATVRALRQMKGNLLEMLGNDRSNNDRDEEAFVVNS